jgi:hypothetical protein
VDGQGKKEGLPSGLFFEIYVMDELVKHSSTVHSANPPPQRQGTLARFVASAVYAAVFLATFRTFPYLALPPLWLLVPLAIVGYYLIIAIHEGGHLLAGHWVRCGFRYMTVGPILICRDRQGLRVRLVRSPLMAGGLAASVPLDTHRLEQRLAVMLAGGLLASLSFGCFGLALLVYPQAIDRNPLLSLLVFVSSVSFAMGADNAIPRQESGFFTDGARILSLWRGDAIAQRWSAVYGLEGEALSGIRPRHWTIGLVKQVTAPAEGALDRIGGLLLAYFWALDRDDITEAGAFLDEAIAARESLPPAYQPHILLEAAYFQARCLGNGAMGRYWLEQVQGGFLVNPHTQLRAQAAVLLAEGQDRAAQDVVAQGLAALDRVQPTGLVEAEADWLREIAARATV